MARLRAGGAEVVDVRPVAGLRRRPPARLGVDPAAAGVRHLARLAGRRRPPLVVVRNPDQDPAEILWQARKIGYDRIVGELDGGLVAWTAAGEPTDAIPLVDAAGLDGAQRARHPPGAASSPPATSRAPCTSSSATLTAAAPAPAPGPTVVMCGHGERAMGAASLLERAGRRDLAVLRRRPDDWAEATGRSPGDRPMSRRPAAARGPAGASSWGCAPNLAQFTLLVAVNALVGGMLGQERTVLPLLGERVFGLRGYTAGLTFILVFGVAKAATNYFAGTWSDRFGRKPVLVAGWLVAVPVPLLLIWAPSWAWVIAANVLLGISQGLTWSTTVIMKIDLVGPARRGFAMGLNEAAGYGAVAVTALATGYLADAVRAAPGAVPARHRLRRPRPRPVHPGGPGDPRARPARGGRPRRPRRRQARPPARRPVRP